MNVNKQCRWQTESKLFYFNTSNISKISFTQLVQSDSEKKARHNPNI